MQTMENPDTALAVEFFTQAVENVSKSREAGRPIHDTREFVRIRFPADNKRELVAPANEIHYVQHAKTQMTYAERFNASYEAFKRDEADFVSGTPIHLLTGLTPAARADFVSQHVRTVEQLAALPDAAIKKLGMGARQYVDMAREFLEKSDSSAEINALKSKIAELEALTNAEPEPDSPFEGLGIDDLKALLRDAGGEIPRGNVSRDRLVSELLKIADAKEEEAA